MKAIIKTFACLLISFFVEHKVCAQEPLLVGDAFPHLELPLLPLPGSAATTIRLPDRSKKLILLDFWATNCAICVAAFPKMEKLQEQYKDQVQIVLVNSESPDSTQRYFKRRKLNLPTLAMVSGSGVMDSLIPRDFVPWHVWIDSKGIVKFITDGYNATPENFETFFRTGSGAMGQLYAGAIFDKQNVEQKSLNDALYKNVQYYSYITKPAQGRSWDSPAVPDDFASFSAKGSIVNLFQEAFKQKGKYDFDPKGTVILEVDSPQKYDWPANRKENYAWKADNYYGYFLMMPQERSRDIYTIAQQELSRFLNVSVSIEQRKIESYVLVATGKAKQFRWNNDSIPKGKLKDFYTYSNVPIRELLSIIRERFLNNGYSQPVLNGTGYDGNLDLRISRNCLFPFNLDQLRSDLQLYGLDIVKVFATTNVLVITEKENK